MDEVGYLGENNTLWLPSFILNCCLCYKMNLDQGRSVFLYYIILDAFVIFLYIKITSISDCILYSSPVYSPTQGKNSWLRGLNNYISGSQNALKLLGFESLDVEAGGYDTLDSSTKLRLLNYLCDEVLETGYAIIILLPF